jgi:two-component system OmpR family response regulator
VTANCPTCGHPVYPPDIYVDVGRAVIARNEVVAALTRRQFEVFDLLLQRYPRVVTNDDIFGLLYDHRDDLELPQPSIIKVLVCKIRKKIAPLGLNIKLLWGTGYALEKADV